MTETTSAGDAIKRLMDIVGSTVMLIATAPLQALVALLVRRDLGRPVLFRQPRPGKNGEIFTLLKFRTMRTAGAGEGVETDGARLTPLGRRLRTSSLDELPTLWNVLRGDMSLVGPRPLLVEYLDIYSVDQARRHDVRPGVTGLAQVSGRNELTWDDRFVLDLAYVQDRSLRLDVVILLKTVGAVLSRRGITGAGSATMPAFRGSSDA